MTINLQVWRQNSADSKGYFATYKVENVSAHVSFLEMIDLLNEKLIKNDDEPIELESDCREGICGCCGVVIDGVAHGPRRQTATCQLHMREYKNGDTITIEPFRATGFPVVKDLVVDRSAFDRIISAGGYISVNTGNAPDANSIPINKSNSELAMDAAACIGCGACVAVCPNASAALFTGAKVSQFSLLPQGEIERKTRVIEMVDRMDKEGFGACSNHGECEAVCPKGISITNIAIMRREYLRAIG